MQMTSEEIVEGSIGPNLFFPESLQCKKKVKNAKHRRCFNALRVSHSSSFERYKAMMFVLHVSRFHGTVLRPRFLIRLMTYCYINHIFLLYSDVEKGSAKAFDLTHHVVGPKPCKIQSLARKLAFYILHIRERILP